MSGSEVVYRGLKLLHRTMPHQHVKLSFMCLQCCLRTSSARHVTPKPRLSLAQLCCICYMFVILNTMQREIYLKLAAICNYIIGQCCYFVNSFVTCDFFFLRYCGFVFIIFIVHVRSSYVTNFYLLYESCN